MVDYKNGGEQKNTKLSEKHKKALIMTGLFALVIAAGVLNYSVTTAGSSAVPSPTSSEKTASAGTGEDVFETFREERTTVREQELQYIDSVMTSTETEDSVKTAAQEQKLALVANMEKELLSEGVLKTSMGLDAVVSVSADLVSVVVGAEEISDEQAAKIAEIIIDQTGQPAQNIKIIPQD